MVHLTGTGKNCLVLSGERVKRPRRGGLFQGTHLKLDDPFLGKAQVHALRVLQVEGTLVELGDGIVGIQQRRLLVHLADDLQGGKNESEEEMSDPVLRSLGFSVACGVFTSLGRAIPVTEQTSLTVWP